ncbi:MULTISPECIES: glycosyltransferase family 4 protein [unclassified Arthrobacter]|uniref:glycosyltransferase family 4 protein n=1 Tax=unclassified Arthrobacter TaxID=235627 RepID=UPI001C845092|nr:glycosyltransferase family 4 protein [Arthrobacter sp. MAHUQ-56]MBX7444915.1 glycosyltransferase family 4 protein [Arthrobacter sp. MAHUQ-56]
MKIIQLVNTLAVGDGGPARNSFELNRAFNRLPACAADLVWLGGHIRDSVIFEEGKIVGELPSPGPRKLGFTTNEGGRRIGLLSLLRSLQSADVLILHGYYLPWVPIATILGRIFGCRVFIMPHGALTARQQRYGRLKKFIFDLGGGSITRVLLCSFVTGSAIEADELTSKFPRSTVQVAGVGVPMPKETKRDPAPHEPIRLLSLSRIADKKRIDLSIDALSHLRSEGIDAVLTIAGEGPRPLMERLSAHARSKGVLDSVEFVGQLAGTAKTAAFLAADFFLLPSEDENFGIGFAEAVSHGLPCVVSTNVAAARHLPYQAGRLVPDPTGRTLAAAVREMLSPTIYRTAQSASRQFAVESLSWSAAVERWVKAVEETNGCKNK